MSSNPSLAPNPLLGTPSCSLMPHIHLTILISAIWSATSFSFLMGQVSLPCNILLCKQLLYNLSRSHCQWYILNVNHGTQLLEFIPSNSNSGLHSCISISINSQHVARTHARTHTHTHTHNDFYSSLDFVRDNPGELVPEGTFRHLLDFLVQNEDNTGRCTNNLDGLPPHPD